MLCVCRSEIVHRVIACFILWLYYTHKRLHVSLHFHRLHIFFHVTWNFFESCTADMFYGEDPLLLGLKKRSLLHLCGCIIHKAHYRNGYIFALWLSPPNLLTFRKTFVKPLQSCYIFIKYPKFLPLYPDHWFDSSKLHSSAGTVGKMRAWHVPWRLNLYP